MTRNSEADLPILHKYADLMFDLVGRTFFKRVDVGEHDHFGFMALCFVHKQLEHARSLGILVDTGQHADAITLARVMLEGYIYIRWAYRDAQERALTWRAFSLVTDWDTLQSKRWKGEPVEPDVEHQLRERLKQHGERFLTKEARKRRTEEFANSYQRSWNVDKNGRRVELREMVQEIEDPVAKELYDDLSQLAHWTPRGIGSAIRRTDTGISVSFGSNDQAAQACAVCLQALGGTAKVAANHIAIPVEAEIDQLFERYLEALGISVGGLGTAGSEPQA